jgi:uncharacterized membrane protein YraQ (UPF0718 family)
MLKIITTTLIDFLTIVPILLIAIFVSQIIKTYLHEDKIKKITGETEKNFAKAAGIGLITPGPLLIYLPILKSLKNKGMPLSLLAAFITGQTLIGPGRIFLEVGYFGTKFFIYRVFFAFLIALAVATGFKILEKNFLKK